MPISPRSTYKSSYFCAQHSQVKQQTGNRRTIRLRRGRGHKRHRRRGLFNDLGSVVFIVVSMFVMLQVKARLSPTQLAEPGEQAKAESLYQIDDEGLGLPFAELQAQGVHLFATPNSIGTIAIGAAEGTRTPEGQRTAIWEHHSDPGNGAANRGTFSWQLGATTPEEGDLKGLTRIQQDAIPHLIQAAEREDLNFDLETLVQGADLWNQAPDAGVNFVSNLKQCWQQTPTMDEAVLCARVESFYNPRTGELEASGFDNDRMRLEADQRRRMQAIKTVLEFNRIR